MPLPASRSLPLVAFSIMPVAFSLMLAGCGHDASTSVAKPADSVITVAVAKVRRQPMKTSLTVSSELVPFQDVDVFAKESGYISQLLVDYGSHVRKGQLLAVLEIPELEAVLKQDDAIVQSMRDQIANAQEQVNRLKAQHQVVHLEFERMNGVFQSRPGLIAQQEVDAVQGRDLSAEAQIEAGKSNTESARSNLVNAQAKLAHDQALFAYSRILAPFDGVVTQRYANLGALMQAGTNSSTQAMPLVRIAQETMYRLVIPVPESYISFVKPGDPVSVHIPSSNQTLPGKVARISSELRDATRTMHTEVDVPNPHGNLFPGVYAEATLTFGRAGDTLVVPLQALDQESQPPTVLVVDSAGRLREAQVSLGTEDARDAEVRSGLVEGDAVVVSDRSGLKPGQPVHPRESSDGAAAGRS